MDDPRIEAPPEEMKLDPAPMETAAVELTSKRFDEVMTAALVTEKVDWIVVATAKEAAAAKLSVAPARDLKTPAPANEIAIDEKNEAPELSWKDEVASRLKVDATVEVNWLVITKAIPTKVFRGASLEKNPSSSFVSIPVAPLKAHSTPQLQSKPSPFISPVMEVDVVLDVVHPVTFEVKLPGPNSLSSGPAFERSHGR